MRGRKIVAMLVSLLRGKALAAGNNSKRALWLNARCTCACVTMDIKADRCHASRLLSCTTHRNLTLPIHRNNGRPTVSYGHTAKHYGAAFQLEVCRHTLGRDIFTYLPNDRNFFVTYFISYGQLAFGYPSSIISTTLGSPDFLRYMFVPPTISIHSFIHSSLHECLRPSLHSFLHPSIQISSLLADS